MGKAATVEAVDVGRSVDVEIDARTVVPGGGAGGDGVVVDVVMTGRVVDMAKAVGVVDWSTEEVVVLLRKGVGKRWPNIFPGRPPS